MKNCKSPEDIKALLKWAADYSAQATTEDPQWWEDLTEELTRALNGTLPE